MKVLRIDFCDFWPGFRKDKNYFVDLLRQRFEVEIHVHPDFVFYSNYGYHHRLYTCPRIYFTGEPFDPDFRWCDYALTWHYLEDPRHFRLPLYPLYFGGSHLIKAPGEEEQLLARKNKFCSFVVGNIHAKASRKRVDFFHRLSRYKKVDSGGSALNNIGRSIGGLPDDKLAFLDPYKFNIAFENQSRGGYTTEKIVQAMRARCVPIYWGSPQIHTEFNPKSFLNYFDFPTEEALIERIIQIDQDDRLYLEMLRQPFFHDNIPNASYQGEALLNFFERIFATPIRPAGSSHRLFQLGRWIAVKKNKPWAGYPPE